jgi:hypothetical protein
MFPRPLMIGLSGWLLLAGCQTQQPIPDPFMQPTVPPPATGAAAPPGSYAPSAGASPGATSPYGGTPYNQPATTGTLPPNTPNAGAVNQYAPSGGWPTSSANNSWRHSVGTDGISSRIAQAQGDWDARIDRTAAAFKDEANQFATSASQAAESLSQDVTDLSNRAVNSARDARTSASEQLRRAADNAHSTIDSAVEEANQLLEPVENSPPARSWQDFDSTSRAGNGPRAADLAETADQGYAVSLVSYEAPLGDESGETGLPASRPGQTAPSGVSVSLVKKATATSVRSDQDDARYLRTSDLRKLRGRLEYSETTGQWKLRYIPIDGKTDDNGGSVLVSDGALLEGYANGEFVEVVGNVADTTKPAGQFAPFYALERIKPLDR